MTVQNGVGSRPRRDGPGIRRERLNVDALGTSSRIVITNFRKLAALNLRDLPERNLPIGQNESTSPTCCTRLRLLLDRWLPATSHGK